MFKPKFYAWVKENSPESFNLRQALDAAGVTYRPEEDGGVWWLFPGGWGIKSYNACQPSLEVEWNYSLDGSGTVIYFEPTLKGGYMMKDRLQSVLKALGMEVPLSFYLPEPVRRFPCPPWVEVEPARLPLGFASEVEEALRQFAKQV